MPPFSAAPPGGLPPFVADLHIHSKYSRACSRDLTLPNLGWWARRKGIGVLGTGDFTHPAWYDHLRETLHPAEPGLFRLSPEAERDIARRLPPRLASAAETDPVRFMLSVEISTIYKRDDRTRKVHHLIYLPDLDAVARFNTALGRIGNLGSDGRPILGLDSRDLLEITLEASPDGYLVPAHIWTPWFSALGSKSGFDAIADCYADLADHVFAVETGLSSDPEMNWRVGSLDRYRLVSNSDAHSPPALAREATVFTSGRDYFAIREALRTGDGLAGTVEFFPEEGKYHADGHRLCGVNWSPERTREAGGRCPECGKPLTVGVLSRVEELADRPEGHRPAHARQVTHLVPLAEILGEINKVGARSKKVEGKLNDLVAALGPELEILTGTPLDEIARVGGELLAEGIGRLRRGEVRRVPGYDGEYGVITLFDPAELGATSGGPGAQDTLFDVPVPAQRKPAEPATKPRARRPAAAKAEAKRKAAPPPPPPIAPAPSPHEPFEPMLAGMEEVGTGLLDRLDAMQRVAASAPGGPLLIVAGPGTGKTRTLTHRIAYLCAELNVFPEQCLAITFTRRAAEELRHRLDGLLGPVAEDVTVGTFHSLGLTILRENAEAAGLPVDFRIADDADRAAARAEAGDDPEAYTGLLRKRDLVDLDELLTLPVALLRADRKLVREYRERWKWIFVDEYQDVDAVQYELLRLLSPADGNLCAIGDPDQAIYSFRGAEVGYFLRFSQDFTDARLVRLNRNYRSSAPILAAAVQAIAPSSLVRGRRLDPARLDPEAPLVGRYAAASVADEADFLVRTIDDLVGGLSHRSLDSGRIDGRSTSLSFSDIAVLYRTDSQAAPIVDALARANIPVQKRSHDRLRDRPGVTAIARELRHAGLDGSLAARVRLAGQVLAERFAVPTLDGSGSVRPEDVRVAVDLLTPLARRCGDDLELFLSQLATGAEVDALDPRAEAVTLLTLHAAKGLEFPVVFLVGAEDGLLPLRWPGSEPDEDAVAEERRLFFVGLTRAQDRLYVSHAGRRTRHGTERECRPSPFLDVIDPGLFERFGEPEVRRPRDRQLRLI
ncbi:MULTISPECIES: UvrD-helicase domain-containing protein [Micromonospora]|uniref:DNA 3'-5' helicase n=1 Tax=Micromonospora solifontis TaxID=2487138 RepID=A0ABX9WI89_9ACTN|nr:MULTISPECIES: UvrD-helicase domain-containing protein [Micromonospora]NES17159.1 UvrD-helicase domain-containing protein [Micromonospora sp. PPF5-17B]NES36243.1 UvrD-helicase domain-containing protein [Micromonospora solifontis]NES58948.1 UvrD-helicase domain-containing protein [Micromonospora sp. PPF5-6]RNL99831.1 AAA family ATPase [Micromonospora solifontis]